MTLAIPICRRLLMHEVCLLRALAFERAGSNNAARIAMIAITTSNSISVNALLALREADFGAGSLPRITLSYAALWRSCSQVLSFGSADIPAGVEARATRRQGCLR